MGGITMNKELTDEQKQLFEEFSKEYEVSFKESEKRERANKWNKRAIIFATFAQKNGFITVPTPGIGIFVDDFLDLGCCACHPERKACPCPQAKEEVEKNGHCACKLFWKDYNTWIEWYKSTCKEY